MEIIESKEYKNILNTITSRVHQAQIKALRAVNTELVSMYWDIGKLIIEKQKEHNWGDSVVDQLADDLNSELEGKSGFSRRNVYDMRRFYITYSESPIVQQLVAQLPWGHNVLILNKIKNPLEAEYYIKSTIKNGWSRSTLVSKIQSKDFESWAINQSNIKEILPLDLSTQAEIILRDDVDLSFLDLEDQHKEYELEEKIVNNITKFLSAMGGDFTFAGRQVPVKLNDLEYRIDLLFFHRILKCLFIVELKAGDFKPEHTAQLGVYISLADMNLRKNGENPTIGMVLCKSKNRDLVDLTLKFMTKPMGVTTYEKSELPEDIAKYLPSEEEISRKLLNLFNDNENTDK